MYHIRSLVRASYLIHFCSYTLDGYWQSGDCNWNTKIHNTVRNGRNACEVNHQRGSLVKYYYYTFALIKIYANSLVCVCECMCTMLLCIICWWEQRPTLVPPSSHTKPALLTPPSHPPRESIVTTHPYTHSYASQYSKQTTIYIYMYTNVCARAAGLDRVCS